MAPTEQLIVFGDDRSAHADRAWLWINNQRWPGWTVDVVTAAVDPADVWSDELPIQLDPWTPSSPRRAFGESAITSVRHLRSSADPRLVLTSCSDASLIVVGPRGAQGVKQLLLGSTTNHLLRHTPAPLLIACSAAPASTVLVCTDGSPPAQHAVETFAGLPLAAAASHIAVVGVASVGMYDDREEIVAGIDRAGAALAARSDRDPERLPVIADGDVVKATLTHARRIGADLLVVGTHGRTGLERVALGSIASGIVHRADCPVLVVPTPVDGGDVAGP